jgi:excisionase family DNA binding protein
MPPDQLLATSQVEADADGRRDAPEAPAEQTVFTTGQVAKICKVSQQTIIRCFDNGTLKGFKVPGGSKHRRIPRASLEKFMKENGIPLGYLTGESIVEESTDEGAE